jgi:hypothetical protein
MAKIDRATKIYRDIIASSPTDKRALKALKTLKYTEAFPALSDDAPFDEQVKYLVSLYNQGQLKDTLRLEGT